MSIEIGCRIFRRNKKNIIILWDSHVIPDMTLSGVFVEKEDGVELPLDYVKFSPMATEKFIPGTTGIIINHSKNNIDPEEKVIIKIVFKDNSRGAESPIIITKEIMPVTYRETVAKKEPSKSIKVYGFDYVKNKWVPFPVDVDSFIIKEK